MPQTAWHWDWLEGCEVSSIVSEWLFFILATYMYSYVSMAGGDEPESTSHTTSAATTSNTTAGSPQHAPAFPVPDTEVDSESGFSRDWISNHETNAARRQSEVREASGGHQHVPDYRISPQQQGHQQQMEVEEEEREYQCRFCPRPQHCM
jgi:hypothetical protein